MRVCVDAVDGGSATRQATPNERKTSADTQRSVARVLHRAAAADDDHNHNDDEDGERAHNSEDDQNTPLIDSRVLQRAASKKSCGEREAMSVEKLAPKERTVKTTAAA